MPSDPLLLLFDIDGTLLQKAHEAHRDALHAALAEVYGVRDPASAGVEAAGRTDGEIARDILTCAGVSAARAAARAAELRAAVCGAYAQLCPADLSGHVAPGIVELLELLAWRDDVRLSLVTGNFEPVARLKLERAGIGHHFPVGQGAFGSDHEDRTMLPAIARRRAGDDARPHPRERTVVIGDTPRDVACARADGVRCLAVASGPYPAAELRGADAVAGGGEELRTLIAGLLGDHEHD